MGAALTVAYCIAAPLLVMWLTWRWPMLRKVGDILLAYAVGCAAGLSGILPQGAESALTAVATATIPLAIPLMLLSADVRAWRHMAPRFAKSMACGVAGCVMAVTAGFLLFGQDNPETNAKVGGMLTGLYTGGTANQASLKVALGVPDAVYLLSHTYSIVVSAAYLTIVIFFGRRLLLHILPPFKGDRRAADAAEGQEDHSGELFFGLFRRQSLPDLGRAMGITACIVAAGAALAAACQWAVGARGGTADVFQSVFILAISLFAVMAASLDRVRRIGRTYEAGTFFILIFSVAVSSQVNTHMLGDVDGSLFGFITVATLGSLILHVALNAVARIDADTTLVSSIALICSPPFVPVMAGALGNKATIGPGIAVGLAGYAIGTYLGFGVAHALMALA